MVATLCRLQMLAAVNTFIRNGTEDVVRRGGQPLELSGLSEMSWVLVRETLFAVADDVSRLGTRCKQIPRKWVGVGQRT